ncbi:MAG: YfiT family bacillithiol transferase, partial [Saprospiraceae bacterium]
MTHSNKDESLRYPIGRFEFHADYGIDNLRKDIKTISKFPKALKTLLKKIKPGDLKCAYRKGGWTVRQIIHHLADSHMNAYIRMKMALTEPNPVIKTYEEHLWADTEDGSSAPVKLSLKLLSALHERWSYFLKLLTEDDLDRCYFHPEYRRSVPLSEAIALYAWHCRHHLAHINLAIVGQMTSKDFASLPDDPAQAAAKPPVSDDKG